MKSKPVVVDRSVLKSKSVVVDSSVIVDAFDTSSASHREACSFIETALTKDYKLVMPMHGYFEVTCALRRLARVEKRKLGPHHRIFDSAMPFHLVPIDHFFIEEHKGISVPYAKAGDTIFLVVAKKLALPLVSGDQPMLTKARSCGIKALTVVEGIQHVAA